MCVMESLEALARSIKTANELHGLVRTMKAMAAVNIRQLENAVEALANYRNTVLLGFQALVKRESVRVVRVAPRTALGILVFGTDQGMCGPLNDHIVQFVLDDLQRGTDLPTDRRMLAIGSRVATRLEMAGETIDTVMAAPSSVSGVTTVVHELVRQIDQWHHRHHVDTVIIYFCEHASRSSYQPRRQDLLPIDRQWIDSLREQKWPTRALPTFTTDSATLLSALVRQFLFVSLYRACAESLASENASRLAAMRSAERNVEDRIELLTQQFHQTRQMTITAELLDIVTGFEALRTDSPEGLN